MSQLTEVESSKLMMLAAARAGNMRLAEQIGLSLPQVTCMVVHHFGPGFCIRELHVPAGTFVIGHQHRQGLANAFIKGRLRLLQDGAWSELVAPFFFIGTPGRKVALALEDCIWQNIITTNETDPAIIEDLFVEKSPEWYAAHSLENPS